MGVGWVEEFSGTELKETKGVREIYSRIYEAAEV